MHKQYKNKTIVYAVKKKMPEDIITLPMCTINHNHMMYDFSEIWSRTDHFFVILDNFLPFHLLNNQKN